MDDLFSDATGIRQVDEAKSDLLSIVSHELKTPLTSIRLETHVLLNEKLGPLSPKQVELMAAAREDSDRLFRIIENLLEIGRMETGRTKFELAADPEIARPHSRGRGCQSRGVNLRPTRKKDGVRLRSSMIGEDM